MIAYKGFRPGLICRGYQFVMGLNTTEKANCRENGFHCAENPLDCLSYYSSLEHSEYYIVNAGTLSQSAAIGHCGPPLLWQVQAGRHFLFQLVSRPRPSAP